ncbi:acetolactate synthase 3 catalytic subunit [Haemophilus influenzae 22.4-21]|uniref:Acetolactate synthase 3 catalytic subunit n=1 Tax=Haemophilus influenzae 22.4-21 TaxID=375063 RepID=A4NZJ0_HAEIF|nr:acetolactate synthase 3 catalytic subunit [Haemophilus influenzae 22.4-21]
MNELVRGLTNLRSLRAAVRELTLEQAENALEKLQTAIEEKRANEAELIKAETERKERLAKYKELMEKEGITPEELHEIFGTKNCINSSKTCSTPCKICVY